MTVIDVLLLFAYDEWANDRLLTAVEQLPPDQVTRQLGGSFPTVGDTMGHIVAVEWIWMQRLLGASPDAVAGLGEGRGARRAADAAARG